MSENIILGRVHKFGDDINTDIINPAQYVGEPIEIMMAHAMEKADPQFSQKVKPGDILVAGKNFGCGSARETAPLTLREIGISVLICEFYARTFYRNAINLGLKALSLESTDGLRDGDELEVNPSTGLIKNLTTGESYQCQPLPPNIMEIMEAGGLLNHLKNQSGGR